MTLWRARSNALAAKPVETAPLESGEVAQPAPREPIDIRSVALTLIAFLALVVVLQYAQAMIIPIVLGQLIYYALDPVVTALARLRVPRALGAAIVLVAIVAGGARGIYELSGQVQTIVQQLPDAARRVRRTLEQQQAAKGTASTIEQVQQAATELEKAADAAAAAPPAPSGVTRVQVEEAPVNVNDFLWSSSFAIGMGLVQALLVLFLAYFLLTSGDLFKRKLVHIAGPSFAQKKITVQILQDVDRQVARFLLVQVITSVVVGIATWLALRWIGLGQAAVWGLLAGVFNTIPYFGPVIVTATIAAVAFLQFETLRMTFLAGGLAFAITTFEGFGLTPWLAGRAARMNAVAIFIGLVFWGWVWGIWGLLLAVPMMMVIKAVCDQVEDFKAIGELLGD
jgi:predicted PurR-regulated permease PerM